MEGRLGLLSSSDNHLLDQFSQNAPCAPKQDASKQVPSLPREPGFTRMWKGDNSKRLQTLFDTIYLLNLWSGNKEHTSISTQVPLERTALEILRNYIIAKPYCLTLHMILSSPCF